LPFLNLDETTNELDVTIPNKKLTENQKRNAVNRRKRNKKIVVDFIQEIAEQQHEYDELYKLVLQRCETHFVYCRPNEIEKIFQDFMQTLS
jgi:hypothetical protein